MFDGHVQQDRSEDEQRLVETAQRALVAVNLGADTTALDELVPLRDSTDTPAVTRELMLLLFSECSTLVAALGDGGATPVKVQVFDDDGAEVSIDNADPPVRTAVRTLLAEVHGNTQAAKDQVEIALRNAGSDEVDSLVLQALRWTIRLAGECFERDLPVAEWIREALEN